MILSALLQILAQLPLLGVGAAGVPASITRVRVNQFAAAGFNCSPTCTVTITSSTGQLGVLAYNLEAGTQGKGFSSITGGGTWSTSAGACISQDNNSGNTVDIAYNLNLTAGTTSVSVTLQANDSSATFVYYEASIPRGSFGLAAGCQVTNSPSAAEPNYTPSIMTGYVNNVVLAFLSADHAYCTNATVSSVGGTASGWTTPILAGTNTPGTGANVGSSIEDALNVGPGTYQAQWNQVNPAATCTPVTDTWAGSAIAFHD